jgi:hypothetical protein
MSESSCDEVFKSGLYDYWVVSHTILPFALTTLGFIHPLLVIVLVYIWESVELIIRDCTNSDTSWSHPESQLNSLIVDPACGFLGVAVAISFARAWGVDPRDEATENPLVQALFTASVLVPSFLFFDWFYTRSLHHLFPVPMVGALILTRTVERSLGLYDVTLTSFVIIFHLVVTLADGTNSFAIALGICGSVILGVEAIRVYRQMKQNDSAVGPSDPVAI